jgi:hypothetical protein
MDDPLREGLSGHLLQFALEGVFQSPDRDLVLGGMVEFVGGSAVGRWRRIWRWLGERVILRVTLGKRFEAEVLLLTVDGIAALDRRQVETACGIRSAS